MTLIAFAAGKGSPGVTTAALALAAVWPREALLVECDPAGGDLAFRFEDDQMRPLAQDKGVLSLSAALRTDNRSGQLWDHAQRLSGGLPVLVGPSSSVQSAALSRVWGPLCEAMSSVDGADVLADLGRVSAGSPSLAVAAAAPLTVVVTRAAVDAMAHLRSAVDVLAAGGARRIRVLVVGAGKESKAAQRQVQEVLTLAQLPASVISALVYDEAGAAGLRREWTRSLNKRPLIESARKAASAIDAELLAAKLPHPPAAMAR